jgi:hypothetical protein
MLRHGESSASLGRFDPDMVGARQRLISQQRFRSRHEIWDIGLLFTGAIAEGPATAGHSADPTKVSFWDCIMQLSSGRPH